MGKLVLTVDDSRTVRTLVASYLKPFGVEVLEAANGAIGITLAKARKPDLILLDYNMPVLDGFHTLAELRYEPDLKTIPVIMLTTETGKQTVLRLIKLGLNDYIAKPFERAILLEKVNPILGLYSGDEPPAPSQPAREMDWQSLAGGFLIPRADVRILVCPESDHPDFPALAEALSLDLVREVGEMADKGLDKLVIEASAGVVENSVLAAKLMGLLNKAQRLALSVRLVAGNERVRKSLGRHPDAGRIPTFQSIEDALASFETASICAER